MSKIVLGLTTLAALATISSAGATDLPVKAPRAVPAIAYNWSGCYVGGYVGGAFQGHKGAEFTDLGSTRFASYSGGVTAARVVPSHSWTDDLDSSFIGGGTLGCNWQNVGSPYVFGLEGEVGYLHLTGRAFDPNTLVGLQNVLDVQGSAKIGDWYAMATGRLGYAWDRTLLYVKGGAAFGPRHASVTDTCLVVTTVPGCGNWIEENAITACRSW